MPLSKKSDTKDALKREGNTAYIGAFTSSRHPGAGSAVASVNEDGRIQDAIKPSLPRDAHPQRCKREMIPGREKAGKTNKKKRQTPERRRCDAPAETDDQAKVSTRPLPAAVTGTWLTLTAAVSTALLPWPDERPLWR